MYLFVLLWAFFSAAWVESLKVVAPYSAVANTNIVYFVLKEGDPVPLTCDVIIKGNGIHSSTKIAL